MKNPFYTAAWRLLRPLILLLHPLDVQGLENIPEGAVLLCGNHAHAIDPVLLIVALNDEYALRVMAKKQLFSIPIVGEFIRRVGAFPVDRGHTDIGAVKAAIRSLKDGFSLLIFPEGTRVKEPGAVTPKSGAAMIAIHAGTPMLPVFIGRDQRLFHRVPIYIGQAYTPLYSGRRGTAEEYQSNTEEILRRVYRLGGIQWR